jgi:hypothetical protein
MKSIETKTFLLSVVNTPCQGRCCVVVGSAEEKDRRIRREGRSSTRSCILAGRRSSRFYGWNLMPYGSIWPAQELESVGDQ